MEAAETSTRELQRRADDLIAVLDHVKRSPKVEGRESADFFDRLKEGLQNVQQALRATMKVQQQMHAELGGVVRSLEAALKASSAHLRAFGSKPSAAALVQSLVTTAEELRAVERALEIEPPRWGQSPSALGAAPEALVSAVELGVALGVGDETVRLRERNGELFSLLRPGRKRGREYPAFQAWSGIVGSPLTEVLKALGAVGGAVAFGFFTTPTELLGGLTPIEAMLGSLTKPRDLTADEAALLAASSPARLAATIKAAEANAALEMA